ncbi:MAG: hypothetical protein IAG13_34525 [Deltaproteobacteria bacterium]|nr:hypothetical protein [Nannocystaceae bacterium]
MNDRVRWISGLALVCACAGDPEASDGDSGTSDGGATSTMSSSSAATTTPATSDPTTSATTNDEGTSGSPSTSDEGGSSDDAADESTGAAPVGSTGCGMAAPASGVLSIDIDGNVGEYVLSIPPGYDPNQPYPLGFAFHGRNRTGPNCHDGDARASRV